MDDRDVSKQAAARNQQLSAMVEFAATASRNLSTLSADQRSEILALVFVGQATAIATRSGARPPARLDEQFVEALSPLFPGRPSPSLSGLWAGCQGASVAYASGMATCMKDKSKTREQCETENAGAAAAEIGCYMNALEKLRELMGRLPGGREPWPGPPPPY